MICKCIEKNCSGTLVKYIIRKAEKGKEADESEVFICNTCQKIYMICPDCDGEGFAQTENGIFDCETCQGLGVTI